MSNLSYQARKLSKEWYGKYKGDIAKQAQEVAKARTQVQAIPTRITRTRQQMNPLSRKFVSRRGGFGVIKGRRVKIKPLATYEKEAAGRKESYLKALVTPKAMTEKEFSKKYYRQALTNVTERQKYFEAKSKYLREKQYLPTSLQRRGFQVGASSGTIYTSKGVPYEEFDEKTGKIYKYKVSENGKVTKYSPR